uniref:Uncharacterized protein n=1 Tax=Dulem virus 39 TaxID=3145757 RepID=A0AAU8B5F5_9CAUD
MILYKSSKENRGSFIICFWTIHIISIFLTKINRKLGFS